MNYLQDGVGNLPGVPVSPQQRRVPRLLLWNPRTARSQHRRNLQPGSHLPRLPLLPLPGQDPDRWQVFGDHYRVDQAARYAPYRTHAGHQCASARRRLQAPRFVHSALHGHLLHHRPQQGHRHSAQHHHAAQWHQGPGGDIVCRGVIDRLGHRHLSGVPVVGHRPPQLSPPLRSGHVRSKHTESHIGSKIVGTVHLILIYIAFNLCLILPLAVEKWNFTAEYYKLVAFLVLAPIGVITAILVIGLSKRRASFLVPFLVLSWVSFIFLLATTPVWAMFMTWYEDGHLVIGNAALLVVLAGAVCLEAWSMAIVYGSYCRLHKLKSEVGLKMTVKPLVVNDSKPPAYTEALHPDA